MNATHPAARRRGFTLVELLVAIAIIAILASLLLGVAATAGRTARESKSKSQVARLHSLLMERYDLYRTRRVELNTRDVWPDLAGNGIPDWRDRASVVNTGINFLSLDARLYLAGGRLVALREMMKLEMPDRWSDVIGKAVPPAPIDEALPPTLFLGTNPSLQTLYLRAYNEIAGRINDNSGQVNTDEEVLTNQGAECLYLIVMNATGDGEARSLFRETDVGDTDGDGAPEFLDGFGQPISFIRWAPGFDSDAQLSVARWMPDITNDPTVADGARSQITEDHDPYDLFRIDNPSNDNALLSGSGQPGLRGWRLLPLIVSPGLDGDLGLETAPGWVHNANPYAAVRNDAGQSYWLGSVGEAADAAELTADNVHSHNVGTLSQTR